MPQVKKQPAKKSKKTDDMAEKLEQAVAFLIDELDDVKSKLDKVMSRMGLQVSDVIGLSDVSSPDTGKGSQLKTGGRRSHNMPSKSKRLIDCMKKAKGNAKEGKSCKIRFATETDTTKQHGYKPTGQICQKHAQIE